MEVEDALREIRELSMKRPVSVDLIRKIVERCALLDITDSDSMSGGDEQFYVAKQSLVLAYSFSINGVKYGIWKKAT